MVNTSRSQNPQFTSILLQASFWGLLMGIVFFAGCQKEAPVHDDVVARVGETSLHLPDFNELFNLAEAGFSGYGLGYTPNRREARQLFLNQLVEELFVLEFARVKGISLAPEALQKAEQQIWQDYAYVNPDDMIQGDPGESSGQDKAKAGTGVVTEPPEAFEQVLQEQALTFQAWQKGLERRLLLEQVITMEVGGRVQVSDEEIRDYLAENPFIPQMRPEDDTAYEKEDLPGSDAASEQALTDEEQKQMARRVLNAQKAQDEYAKWLLELKEMFPVTVKPELL